MNKASKRILEEREARLKLQQESLEGLPPPKKEPVRPNTTRASAQKSTWGQAKKAPAQEAKQPGKGEKSENTFAPKINKMPESLAAKRENRKIEELLYEDAKRKKERQEAERAS